ncbi:hypothetical protein AAFF_G00131490 [Aldrovandia affinis]|uniref:Uncharacterized protein n=1 Tax=Aldrovandia affinis TaxID=143900 RepID=A0AAD7RQM4_9TELE|nr:hypothetical protein AAFF_G00131490 [Aldrovandia affinis]
MQPAALRCGSAVLSVTGSNEPLPPGELRAAAQGGAPVGCRHVFKSSLRVLGINAGRENVFAITDGKRITVMDVMGRLCSRCGWLRKSPADFELSSRLTIATEHLRSPVLQLHCQRTASDAPLSSKYNRQIKRKGIPDI